MLWRMGYGFAVCDGFAQSFDFMAMTNLVGQSADTVSLL
jgi:hypothetical protein